MRLTSLGLGLTGDESGRAVIVGWAVDTAAAVSRREQEIVAVVAVADGGMGRDVSKTADEMSAQVMVASRCFCSALLACNSKVESSKAMFN